MLARERKRENHCSLKEKKTKNKKNPTFYSIRSSVLYPDAGKHLVEEFLEISFSFSSYLIFPNTSL